MQELIDKIGWLLMPEQFAKLLPYCFWYWMVFLLNSFLRFEEKIMWDIFCSIGITISILVFVALLLWAWSNEKK